uniref:Apple domain-containing protein n=1 Tax=Meloidogyne hapla TaxID=6305 RepID=A0A1I8AYM6_MELHA
MFILIIFSIIISSLKLAPFLECPTSNINCNKIVSSENIENCEGHFGLNKTSIWKPHERFMVEKKNPTKKSLCQKCVEQGKCGMEWNGVLFTNKSGGMVLRADILGEEFGFKNFGEIS